MRNNLWFSLNILLWAFLVLSSAEVFAQTSQHLPITSQENKTIIKSEKIHSDKEKKDFIIEKYKTTVYKERVTKEIQQQEISKNEKIYTKRSIVTKEASINQYETTVITPKRITAKGGHVAENIFVMTKEDIARLPVRDLSEALAYMPGVDVQLNGQYGQATSLSINGSYSRQVLLMIDGIPMNTQLSGQANPAQIPIEMIERIELIKGASSSSWGSGLGGVIHVITRQSQEAKKIQGQWAGLAGGRGTTKNMAEVSGRIDRWAYFMSGNYFNTDGISSETDARTKNSFNKLTYAVNDETQLTASFGYNGGDVNFGITPSNTIIKQPYVTRYGQLAADMADGDDRQYHVGYKYNDQSFTSDIVDASTLTTTFSTVNANVYHGLSLNNSFKMREDDVFVAGVDLDWQTLKSSKYLSSSRQSEIQAPYLNYTLAFDRWDVIPGVRYDHNLQFGSQTSPSLGAVYRFYDEHPSLLRAKVSRAFNAPPLMWMFNNDPGLFVGANPDLKAERAWLYELGASSQFSTALNAEINGYYADVNDGIALVFDSGNSVFVQRNFKKFKRRGCELLANYQWTEEFKLYGGGAFNDVRNAQDDTIVRDQGIARQSFKFGGQYINEKGWGVNLLGHYDRWSSSASLQANDRKPIFDLKLSKDFDHDMHNIETQIFFNVYNLANSKYWSSITYPLASRHVEGGLVFKF